MTSRLEVIERHLTGGNRRYSVIVCGVGMMGGSAAAFLLRDDLCSACLCDASEEKIRALAESLRTTHGVPGHRITTAAVDLQSASVGEIARLFSAHDAVFVALRNKLSKKCLASGLVAGVPTITLSLHNNATTKLRHRVLREARLALGGRDPTGYCVLGAGLEPGLTEIQARALGERLDKVEELHIRCGGITAAGPSRGSPFAGYKIVFGSQLPLDDNPGSCVVEGRFMECPRYAGVETEQWPGIGEIEVFNEDFVPWLLDLEAFRGLRAGSQKTCRWPGYAAIASRLVALGLATKKPIPMLPTDATVDAAVRAIAAATGHQTISAGDEAMLERLGLLKNETPLEKFSPAVRKSARMLTNAVVSPPCKLAPGEKDMTLLSVTVIGVKQKKRKRIRCRLVDRGVGTFTSMARTTAFTGAAITRLAALGRASGLNGLIGSEDRDLRGKVLPVEQVVHGNVRESILRELERAGIRFSYQEEEILRDSTTSEN